MRISTPLLAVLLVPFSLAALVACSSDDTSPESADSGASGADGASPDATVADGAADDGGGDATTGDASDANTPGNGDASDAGADAPHDAGPTPCTDASTCPSNGGTASCCEGFCTDTTKDPHNCGACGVDCGNTLFCNGIACHDVVLNDVCLNAKATVVRDPLTPDLTSSASVGAGLAACTPVVAVAYVDQDDSGVLEPGTMRPITGVGDTFAAAGGPFGQHGVGYQDTAGRTPILPMSTDGGLSFVFPDGGVVVSASNASLTTAHDYFVVMLSTEPSSGTLVLSVYGLLSEGTIAGGWYFQNHFVPQLVAAADAGTDAGLGAQWYVYEWTDSGDAGTANGPDDSDTWNLLGSGGP